MILRQGNTGPILVGTVDGQLLTWDAARQEWLPRAEAPSGVQSVRAGTGIAVNDTDPANPIVANAGVLGVGAGTGVAVDNTDPQHPVIANAGVLAVSGGTGITIDNSVPGNPIVDNDGLLTLSAGNTIVSVGGAPSTPALSVLIPSFVVYGDSGGTTAGTFLAPFSNFDSDPTGASETLLCLLVSRPGTFKGLVMGLTTGTSTGACTVVVRTSTGGGAFGDSAITATIANGARLATDLAHTVHVGQGDCISMKTTTSATFAAGAKIWASLDFLPD